MHRPSVVERSSTCCTMESCNSQGSRVPSAPMLIAARTEKDELKWIVYWLMVTLYKFHMNEKKSGEAAAGFPLLVLGKHTCLSSPRRCRHSLVST